MIQNTAKRLPLFLHTTSIILIITLISSLSSGCKEKHSNKSAKEVVTCYTPQYAKNFAIEYYKDSKAIKFYRKGKLVSTVEISPNELPTFASMSQTALSFAEVLAISSQFIGIADIKYCTEPAIQERIKNKTIVEIGINSTIYPEIIAQLHPSYLLASVYPKESYSVLEELGISVIPLYDYLETHPLGRYEWLMVIAALSNKEEEALTHFKEVADRYNYWSEKALKCNNKPTIFDANEYTGTWYLSGGKSYMAQFYRDAGALYAWNEDQHTASFPQTFEAVYIRGKQCDYWRTYTQNRTSYQSLIKQNEHYADFNAFKKKQVIICNTTKSHYYTRATIQPDRVLMDFISLFHPTLLPDYHYSFFTFLEENK